MNTVAALGHRFWTRLRKHDPHPASHAEKLISTAGGFFGVLLVLLVSGRILDAHGATLVVASMGASAVLLFATPHSPLSQPWSLLGGHLISAFIGITCAKLMGSPFYAGAVAVGLSIGAMHYFRCLHPPGGATALVAVLGGESVHTLGYWFLVTPVLANVLIILIVAVAANYPFRWRRYPEWLSMPPEAPGAAHDPHAEKCMIAHSDLVYALSEMDSFIDITEEDLLRIYHLAIRRTHPILADAA
ncbi:MAG: HPP family protein [Sulfuricellaceae bacterium]|nr:HPP family protein [Sulfuricellaceae bacterium]